MSDLNIVTGAFSYTGKYITRRLLTAGKLVRTLTGHPDRPNPFGPRVSTAPLSFDQPELLVAAMRGATTLFNTYWIRFAHAERTFERAVENTRTLVTAAGRAGLRRIVHLSITNPCETSPLPYFAGKARCEKLIVESGLSYAILRPTVIFGPEGILINNIAWMLRRFPAFAVPGRGDYRLQPVFVEDLADLAVRLAEQQENTIVDAVGPETFTFDQLVRLIRRTIRSRSLILRLPPRLAYLLSEGMGLLLGDVVLTRDEVTGLMANLLVSGRPPTATTRLSDWLARQAPGLGREYFSEMARHYR